MKHCERADLTVSVSYSLRKMNIPAQTLTTALLTEWYNLGQKRLSASFRVQPTWKNRPESTVSRCGRVRNYQQRQSTRSICKGTQARRLRLMTAGDTSPSQERADTPLAMDKKRSTGYLKSISSQNHSRHTTPKTTPPATPTESRTEAEIIRLIEGSKQGAKFKAFMAGDFQGHGSHSEADLALIGVMTFWTRDALILNSIFRKSALYRPKWDEKHRADGATYGEMTIETALSEVKETYTQPKHRTRRRRRTSFYQTRAKRRRHR